MTLYKCFKKGLKSEHGNIDWKIGKWQRHKGKLEMCKSGFHASENIIDAMGYVKAEEIALVEVKGKHIGQEDKQCWEYMRISKVWEWKKEDSVSLAIFAAELCIDNFEKEYPDDKRPRQAIEAAKAYLKNPSEENMSAAGSAALSARSAALSARSAAESAALSAGSAAWSAGSAAESAAWSAGSAALSARSAGSAALSARSGIKKLCHDFAIQRLEEKE